MKLPRRKFLHLAAGAAALPAASRIARAESYPTRPVHWVVPSAPAGPADIVARLMGQWLSKRLKQPFIVENRPGGGNNIGTEFVVRASPDGYTILGIASNNAINTTLYEKLSFSFIRDIAPVASLIRGPVVMAVNPSFPAKTVPEFIAYAKAHPGEINFASGGIGFATHVSGELFKMMTGINMVHVPYRGEGPALTLWAASRSRRNCLMMRTTFSCGIPYSNNEIATNSAKASKPENKISVPDPGGSGCKRRNRDPRCCLRVCHDLSADPSRANASYEASTYLRVHLLHQAYGELRPRSGSA
jgi:tripartite-type tricarboxylate transporter receptor subunit TctC